MVCWKVVHLEMSKDVLWPELASWSRMLVLKGSELAVSKVKHLVDMQGLSLKILLDYKLNLLH